MGVSPKLTGISRMIHGYRKKAVCITVLSVVVILSLYSSSVLQIVIASIARDKPSIVFIDDEDLFRFVALNVFIHSAYWDTRAIPSVVRIIAIGPLYSDEDVMGLKCLHYFGSDSHEILEGKTLKKTVLIESWRKNHTAVYYTCQTVNDTVPIAVSLAAKNISLSDLDHTLLTWKPVKLLSYNDSNRGDLAVCVRPLFSHYNNTMQLMEFLSYYHLMGASHFLFMDYQVGPNVRQFLQSLTTSKNVNFSLEFKKWNLPDSVNVHELGQVVANQYFVLKNLPHYKYVAILDVDELIVSKVEPFSLLELIRKLDKPQTGSFLFRNNFFCGDHQNRPEPNTVKKDKDKYFISERVNRKENEIWPAYTRSKVIVKPETVLEQAIHFVYKYVGYHETKVLSPEICVLNHYRLELNCSQRTSVDKFIWEKHGPRLLQSPVFSVWKSFAKIV